MIFSNVLGSFYGRLQKRLLTSPQSFDTSRVPGRHPEFEVTQDWRVDMSRRCELTGKGPLVGYQVSHSHHKTKNRQLPNLQKKRIWVPELGRFVRLNVTTRALRTITKLGLAEFCRKNNLDFDAVVGR